MGSTMPLQFDGAIESPTIRVLNTLGKGRIQSFLYAIVRLFDPSPWQFSKALAQGPPSLTLSENWG